MTRRQANLLLVAAAWTMYVWISFVVIQTRQNTSVAFKVVHGVLALISMGFGLAVGVVGWRARRTQTAEVSTPSSRPAESAAPERV